MTRHRAIAPANVARPGIRRAARTLRRALDTVSMRLIAIILFSSIPLAVLCGLVSWHTYRAASDTSATRAVGELASFRSRVQQDLTSSLVFLDNLATDPELSDPARCEAVLRLSLLVQQPRYQSMHVRQADGHVGCRAGQEPAAAAGDATSGGESLDDAPGAPSTTDIDRGDRRVAPSRVRAGTDAAGRPLVYAELIRRLPGDPVRFVAAWQRLGWNRAELFGDQTHVGMIRADLPIRAWMVGPDGRVSPLCQDCGWAQPPGLSDLIARASAEPGVAVADGVGAAAVGAFAGPVRLLVATRPTRDEIHALSVFVIRVILIVLLLGLGLVLVSIAANQFLVAPLQRLTGAVTQWRRAGEYDPQRTRLMPTEVRELSRAFTSAARSLALHEERLREGEVKQELLIKEIHHRVKNNLQIIASLLNLQANRIRQPEARAEFASARDRVRALATLHRYLYTEGDLQTLNARLFLQELCAQLFQAIGERQGRRIQLHIEAPEIEMATDQAVPLALIVTEAVSNAVKYAFPGGRSGHVRVDLAQIGGGMGRLVIEDDGIGIPAGRSETETGIRDGLGIQLIRGFARQLGAQLAVDESDGTRYTLTFPLHPREPDREAEPAQPEHAVGDA